MTRCGLLVILFTGVISNLSFGMSSRASEVKAPGVMEIKNAYSSLEKPKLVPWPQKIDLEKGSMIPCKKLAIWKKAGDKADLDSIAKTCAEDFNEIGFSVTISSDKPVNGETIIGLEIHPDNKTAKERYRLAVGDRINISATNEMGLFWGTRTALQLLAEGPGKPVRRMSITDYPLLGHRGALVDVARQFHSIDFHYMMVKRLAAYKLNIYHIHFSDDQSYTLPSEKFPTLPTEGRNYTKEQIKQLVQLAKRYHVTIVPEIDVPGHALALTKSIKGLWCDHYKQENPPVVCMGSEQSYKILEELMTEVMEMLPGPYWHLGADEVKYAALEGCSVCAAKIKEENLKDTQGLYHYFINRMHTFVKGRGRVMFVWEGFTPGKEPIVDKEIIVYPFDCFHETKMPRDYVNAGYTLVNTSWIPLYIAHLVAAEPNALGEWDHFKFCPPPPYPAELAQNLRPTQKITGAQMCSWEKSENAEEGLFFGTAKQVEGEPKPAPRLQVVAERIWTGSQTATEDLLERIGWD